jgi:serine/threonine protein kinase
MEEPDNKDKKPTSEVPKREIGNAELFSSDIVFSDTEKILFEEDLKDKAKSHDELMDGDPAERYTPHRKLNQGGMKAIWEVDDHRTARKVAMALIQDSKIASEEDIDSFLYEARLTANLQHPNIIPIYDIAVDESGNPYFTMKALKGETLSDIIKKLREGSDPYRKQYTRTRLLGIFLKVCNAIDYAHTKGVIHLDLKPSNVIVGDFGDVHVLDWGLSTLITHLDEYDGEAVSWHSLDDVALENGQTLTRYLESTAKRRHIVGGTPGYMSPEQAQGAPADIDFQTDVYMLGSMLYEILTLECPVTGDTIKEVLQKTVRGDFPSPTKRAPSLRIPPALAAIANKAMQSDPKERYPNVAALIHDIHQFQDGFATIAENPTFVTHFTLLIRRHLLAVSLIAGFVLIIGIILTNSYLSIKTALDELKVKNDYIEQTARLVAPDYLDLMQRAENAYAFKEAEQALNTSIAFNPDSTAATEARLRILLSQRRFDAAGEFLSERTSTQIDRKLVQLAEKYVAADAPSAGELQQLAADFLSHGMSGGLPRLFYHANQAPFVPESHFRQIAESIRLLNPNVENLHFDWKEAESGGWEIDISGNPQLDDITPFCGMNIARLDAGGIGAPSLELLTEDGLRSLNLSGTSMNHLADLDQFANLEELEISGTQIRNISNIANYPRLKTLDISGIEGLSISPQLVWCRSLKLLTVAERYRGDPTLQTLARRGVIIIYTDR